MVRHVLGSVALLLATLLVVQPAHAVPYEFFSPPTIAGVTPTQIIGINNLGEMVGSYSGGAFRYAFGVLSPAPGDVYGINDAGDIVGHNGNSGYIVRSDGQYISLNFPGADITGARGINNLGDVVGFYRMAGGLNRGFIWSRGVFTSIEAPSGGDLVAQDINDYGDVVGTIDAFVFRRRESGEFDSFDLNAGGVREAGEYAFDTNNAGDIVGRGWIYSGGVFAALPGGDVHSINDFGQIAALTYLGTPVGTPFPARQRVPEASTLVLVVAGLAMLVAALKSRPTPEA